ncbi:hypothetical protein JQ597_15960 [Bradyrhizobium sp. AUGA SZCCT0177]|uniref:hypothetical protein n=1 Tax=Bradyrhizobium sp. AUGA SZCCT0177 TaxID=2807665 RepID=UPI001BAB938D|nr:hypothetical protein [Bradyrhizobium sp. AUGA SZCCT0177]MBR1283544.1 hypothetical protein [Bradyrhizobium sp. AUGA SZCCT0177]
MIAVSAISGFPGDYVAISVSASYKLKLSIPERQVAQESSLYAPAMFAGDPAWK